MEFQHDLKTFSPSVNPDGSVHVSYTGSVVLVPKQDFNALISAKNGLEETQKLIDEVMENDRKLVADAKKCVRDSEKRVTEKYLTSHKGGYDKVGCGHRADAEILAAAVLGASVEQLLKGRYTYDKYGHKRAYGKQKIYGALSVKKPEDYGRITGLINDFPDVFANVGVEAVYCWMQKKASKGGKSI